jgi:hypothetical protein
MTDANARLRQRLRGICDHRIGEMIDAMIGELEWEARTSHPTLTDEERKAVEWAAWKALRTNPNERTRQAALRSLLARTKEGGSHG